MTRYRYHEQEDSTGSTLVAAALGALAGLAAGVLLAQKIGGLAGLRARFRERLERRRATDEFASPLDLFRELAGDAYADDEAIDDEESEAAEAESEAAAALERAVLAALLADPVFRERAVDVGAIGPDRIALAGWVHSGAEHERIGALVRRVPGVGGVRNELLVGDPDVLDAEDLAPRT